MAHQVLTEIVLILLLAAATATVMRFVRMPTIAGFLLAGVLIGPGGFGLVTDRATIEILAEVGVVLILFVVGLKISPVELGALRGYVFGVGALQVLITVGLAVGFAVAVGLATGEALVWGYIVSLSSTALVLTLLEERGELDTAPGRMMLGILIFQDLAVVPMMLSLPLLAGFGQAGIGAVAVSLVETALLLAAVGVGAHFLFPRLLERIALVRSREIFTLGMLLIALGTALIVARLGLSMAIGAFLAGVALSESEYSQQILAEITILKDILNALFFVSIGLLVDPGLWLERPAACALLLVVMVAVKGLVTTGLAAAVFRSRPPALFVGAGLAHAGEFSFVLAGAALAEGVLDETSRALFLAVAVPSMLLAPPLLTITARLVRGRALPGESAVTRDDNAGESPAAARCRAVIVGFGLNGRNVARVLRGLGVPYSVVEINPTTVRALRRENEPVVYGDAAREPVLLKAGTAGAQTLVVAISDPAGARQIVGAARRLNPRLRIVVRTRYVTEIDPLLRLGADRVVPEEFETSLELAGQVLAALGAPAHAIEREKALLREAGYGFLRGAMPQAPGLSLADLVTNATFHEVRVPTASRADGASLAELHLRSRSGASVLVVRRGDGIVVNPEPGQLLAAGDELLLVGAGPAIEAAERVIVAPRTAGEPA